MSDDSPDLLIPNSERIGMCYGLRIANADLFFHEVTDVAGQILIAIEIRDSDVRIVLPINEDIYADLMFSVNSDKSIEDVFQILAYWYSEFEYTRLQIKVMQPNTLNEVTIEIPRDLSPNFVRALAEHDNYSDLESKIHKFKRRES